MLILYQMIRSFLITSYLISLINVVLNVFEFVNDMSKYIIVKLTALLSVHFVSSYTNDWFAERLTV